MALMRRYPDKHFDLAIVDPPYGIGADSNAHKNGMKCKANGFREYRQTAWDGSPPPPEYFTELRRVSREQIIWGGNYFPLPPTPCWLIWDKGQRDFSFADGELAWTSLKTAVRIRTIHRATANVEGERFHPTQKPVALYQWLLERYATPGQRILDTHLGSGSHAIACHYAGMHLTACEIDPDYFAAAQERIARETRQTTLF
jgi:site-specific DNA-methyltransferase (adenine-specific)